MKKSIIFIFMLSVISSAQTIFTQADVDICSNKFEFAADNTLSEKPIGEVMVAIGKTSLGLDYEAHTLEVGDSEQLVIHLTGLDCYTFYESALAFSRCIKKQKTEFEDFQNEIKNIRYRNGSLDGYISRLHYAVDWLFDNQRRGIVKDVTEEIGGIKLDKKVGFMSENPDLYARLKDSPENVRLIKLIEDQINQRDHYYIPADVIESAEKKIRNGDLIFCTTNYNGLIVGHTGIAIKMDDERIHFMHAPLAGAKVQITELPLADYIDKIEKHTGIIVIRPLEPECGNENGK